MKRQGPEHRQEFTIFFIGDYGKQVLSQFRILKRRYPISSKCKFVSMDINSEDGFIQLSDGPDPADIFPMTINCDIACFVMDAREPNAVALAENTCRSIRKSTDAIFLCLTPTVGNTVKRETFHMAVATFAAGSDLCADLLLTLHNTYLGCGNMGSIQCLKYLFDIMELKHNYYQAAVGRAVQKGDLSEINIPGMIRDVFRYIDERRGHTVNGSFYGVLEMNPSEMHVLPFYHDVMTALAEKIENHEHGVIVHLGLQRKEVRLTILNLLK